MGRQEQIVVIACVILTAFWTQIKSANAEEDARQFSRFRAHLYSGKKIEGTKASLTPSTLTATTQDGKVIEIPTNEITSLEIVSGTKAAEGALLGAGVGLLTALLTIVQVSLDDEYDVDENAAVAVTAGLTAGSGLVGAVIGRNIQEWTVVPIHSRFSLRARQGLCLSFLSLSF